MSEQKDIYYTIDKPTTEVLFKDKNSKFFGYAYPVTSKEQVKQILETLKKQHYAARHWCYAWQLGDRYQQYRANDDGEPSNSAGQPIYGQLQAFNLTNTLVVVVRYFGGVKLGVGGLINAYRAAAQMALESAEVLEKTINAYFRLQFEYKDMNKVLRILKENQCNITQQKLEMSCQIDFAIREKNQEKVQQIFANFYGVSITELEP